MYLSLKNNKIGPKGLEALAQALESNTTLKTLTLFGNEFNNANGKKYSDLIQYRLPYTGVQLDFHVYIVDGAYMIAAN